MAQWDKSSVICLKNILYRCTVAIVSIKSDETYKVDCISGKTVLNIWGSPIYFAFYKHEKLAQQSYDSIIKYKTINWTECFAGESQTNASGQLFYPRIAVTGHQLMTFEAPFMHSRKSKTIAEGLQFIKNYNKHFLKTVEPSCHYSVVLFQSFHRGKNTFGAWCVVKLLFDHQPEIKQNKRVTNVKTNRLREVCFGVKTVLAFSSLK